MSFNIFFTEDNLVKDEHNHNLINSEKYHVFCCTSCRIGIIFNKEKNKFYYCFDGPMSCEDMIIKEIIE